MASDTAIGQDASNYTFDPTMVNITSDDFNIADVLCYLQQTAPNDLEEPGSTRFGVRISSIFVIWIVATAVTLFPVVATRAPKLRIPLYVYLFARYFGSGVIVATAFIHLLDPAYSEIGPETCVGMTGGWGLYAFCPAIVMSSAIITFFLDFAAERYVEKKYGLAHGASAEQTNARRSSAIDAGIARYASQPGTHQYMHSGEVDGTLPKNDNKGELVASEDSLDLEKEKLATISFQQQFAAFLILEFGVIFHSVIIGLTLATSEWDDFWILYIVIVFHQSFEGMGIGARLSAIQFPRAYGSWLPWVCCISYGLSTPIAIAVGLGVRSTYQSGSYTANVVSGVLDAISAGILLYTGFVELLARDLLFNPERTNDDKQLTFISICILLGAGLMALLGKWA